MGKPGPSVCNASGPLSVLGPTRQALKHLWIVLTESEPQFGNGTENLGQVKIPEFVVFGRCLLMLETLFN